MSKTSPELKQAPRFAVDAHGKPTAITPSTNFASGNAVYRILAHFTLSCGTGMMLLANPDSHFSLQKPIYIYNGTLSSQVPEIAPIDSSLLSPVTR
jgi:hypothetical protein